MLDAIPDAEEMTALVGQSRYDAGNKLCALVGARYDLERSWNKGGKAWKYEYKYRRVGKTRCALYARENCMGFLIVLCKNERQKFEADKESFSKGVREIYDKTHTYHDGKWLLFEPTDTTLFAGFMRLLNIKRKPNKK